MNRDELLIFPEPSPLFPMQDKKMVNFFEPENAHEESTIEWWFFQGIYGTNIEERIHFMVSLFRSNLGYQEGTRKNGFQVLVAVLDADGKHSSSSRIDSAVVQETIIKLKTIKKHIDPAVQKAMGQELETYGPPYPIVVDSAPTHFRASPLEIDWNGFSLAQRGDRLTLKFNEPGTGCAVSLDLEALVPCMDGAYKGDVTSQVTGMEYRTYPKVKFEGLRSDEPVTGEAWMDHQWGNTGWFWDSISGVLLGWDWFGINLENGTNWIVILHRNAQTGTTVGMHATVGDATGVRQVAHHVSLTPLRFWESSQTHIRYPVAWRIEIPELRSFFTFEPLADDQEVACFGSIRSVWEGAGRVTGSVCGRLVQGRARGEFHGYGYIFDHEKFVQQMGRRVDRCLEEFLPRRFDETEVEKIVGKSSWQHEVDAYTEMISVPVWDLIDRAGKRWRPVFGILLLEALGVPSGPYEGLISSLELIHAGALIIDDIEDESSLRRGKESLHNRYGLDVALNAGNALYFLPSLLVMNHPCLSLEQRLRLLEIKERVCIDAHCGQATDIYWSRTMSPDRLTQLMEVPIETKILQMYAFKTAAASKGVAQCAAAIACAESAATAACADFGLALGISFQIVDDIHNFSRSSKWSKTAGEDIANSKLTYVIATALRRLEPCHSARLGQILCSKEMRKDQAILQEGIELVHGSGALEECRERAREMIERAWERFAQYVRSSEPKIMLRAMCLKLLDLAFDG